MTITYQVSGRGSNGGSVSNLLYLIVTVKVDGKPTEGRKEDLQVYVEGPEPVSKVTVLGGDRGSYVVAFLPQQPGEHWLEVVFKGEWSEHTYGVGIRDELSSDVPSTPYTGSVRKEHGKSPAALPSGDSKVESKPVEKKKDIEAEKKANDAEEEEDRRKAEADKKKKDEQERKKKEEEERKKVEEERYQEEQKRKRREEEDRKEEERQRLEADRQEKQKRAQERLAAKKASKSSTDLLQIPLVADIKSIKMKFRALTASGTAKNTGGDEANFAGFNNGNPITSIKYLSDGEYEFECDLVYGENRIDIQCHEVSVKGFPLVIKRKTDAELKKERESKSDDE
eukprot:TRINITY_DN8325_c0_g1_i1.p1 TRINITY_DN8325_c0_g1~~TRINITY_DN8325_c0_g1_i1.p1  ORF type:complete len:340 (+),score=122.22 TRINITY_DN8325_c0_g1_i1:1086-2105(+)